MTFAENIYKLCKDNVDPVSTLRHMNTLVYRKNVIENGHQIYQYQDESKIIVIDNVMFLCKNK